ncbi:MAG: helix-turn-helix transcriptional regulator [Pseudomonadota bacterium]
MAPEQLRKIRQATGLSQARFARALGYVDRDAYRKYESGSRPIPLLLSRLAFMIERYGLPPDWIE